MREDETEFEEAGKQLAVLLKASSLSDEEKGLWAAAIPEMSFEQIDRFTKILESKMNERYV